MAVNSEFHSELTPFLKSSLSREGIRESQKLFPLKSKNHEDIPTSIDQTKVALQKEQFVQKSAPFCYSSLVLTFTYVVFDRDCLGVIGCEWCQAEQDGTRDRDGKVILQPLRQPYCSSQIACFGGVVGAQTPYGDRPQGKLKYMIVYYKL